MPKDYASRSYRKPSKKRRKGQKRKPPPRRTFKWRLCLLLIIAVITVAIIARFSYTRHKSVIPPAPDNKGVDVTAAKPAIVNRPVKDAVAPQPSRSATIIFQPASAMLQSPPPYAYTLLVGTVTRLSQADEVRDHVQRLGYKVTVSRAQVEGSPCYRLQIGPYKTAAAAATEQTALQRHEVVTVIHPLYYHVS